MINFHKQLQHKNIIAMNLTSLIDVLFLLVIFFLLTTKFITSDSIELSVSTLENNKAVSDTGGAVVVNLIEGGKFSLSGQEYKLDELQVRVGELIRGNKEKDIVLIAREGSTVQNMVMAMDKIKAAGGMNVSLAQ